MALVTHAKSYRLERVRVLAALAASLMVAGCGGQIPGGAKELISQSGPVEDSNGNDTTATRSELEKATEYWGKEYAKAPRELKPALNYARNLKAMGEKQRAMAVLQSASLLHSNSRELASEYGRLALDLDQVQVAERLLTAADDPANPDWRVISARGTVLAKQGKYADAIPFYERALSLKHDHPSLLSNLALATAMNGQPDRAETLLRRATLADPNSPKIRQNLALVLGLQGKYDEAKMVASRDLSAEKINENTEYLRRIVKLEPKPTPPAPAPAMPAEPPVATTGQHPAEPDSYTEPTKQAPPSAGSWQVSEAAQAAQWSVVLEPAQDKIAPAPAVPTEPVAAEQNADLSAGSDVAEAQPAAATEQGWDSTATGNDVGATWSSKVALQTPGH